MNLTPFLQVSLVWLAVGSGLSIHFGADSPGFSGTLFWFAALSLLCLMDLLSLTKAIGGTLELVYGPEDGKKNRAGLLIQASSWAVIKLACLGFLGLILFSRGHAIPSVALLLGLGTMVVIPLFGGFWWQRRISQHA